MNSNLYSAKAVAFRSRCDFLWSILQCRPCRNCIFINGDTDEIDVALACKPVEIADDGGPAWRGAMIGARYTRPQKRRAGLASELLPDLRGE